MNDYKEDQASRLRKQMEEIQRDSTTEKQTSQPLEKSDEISPAIDILNLPPRSHVHSDKKAKTKWKVNFLFIRFLFVLFIIIVGLVLTFQYWGEDLFGSVEQHNTVYSHPAGEKVNIVSFDQLLSDEITIRVPKETLGSQLAEVTGRYYIVNDNDTLLSIAEKYYQTSHVVSLLRELNQLDSDIINAGQQLFLPNEKELKVID